MNLSMFDLSGKIAVVIGGSSGIGKAIAEGLAEAGANIAICARRFDVCKACCSEIAKLGRRAFPIKCDSTNSTEVDGMIEVAVREFGKVDILVYSAGAEVFKPIIEMTNEDWQRVIDVNLTGAFLCGRVAARQMVKQGSGGKIIFIASVAYILAMKYGSAYCSSKAGIVQLAREMALELASYNIQVNTVSPGYFLTPFNEEFFSILKNREKALAVIPMRRLGDTKELKGVGILLASSASDYMTGSNIVIDGGLLLT